MDRRDFDRDGQVDLMFTTIEVEYLTSSLWKRWKGLWGDDIWLDLEFYRNEGGLYPDKPDITRRIQLDGTPSPSEPGWVPLDIVLRGGTHETGSSCPERRSGSTPAGPGRGRPTTRAIPKKI